MTEADLIIVGAGPAGMAAARTAADHGLSVVLLDEQKRAGGQIYRDIETAGPARSKLLGKDYTAGLGLAHDLKHDNITHLRGAVVWQIENKSRVTFTRDGKVLQIMGKRLLIATGALERPMPVPGWTLPGVMTAGAAQILLKQSGILCERAVLAGSGPLLYLLAAQMVRAGKPPLALVETQTFKDTLQAMRHLPGALRGWRYLLKGMGLLSEIRRAGVKRYRGADGLSIHGTDTVQSLSFTSGGQNQTIDCSHVLLHHGVVPNTQATRSIDIPHDWSTHQHCFSPRKDAWGRTPLKEVFVAGDGAGIGGAKAAELAGRIAALEIAHDLNAIGFADRELRACHLRSLLSAELAARPFIDRAYPPCSQALTPEDSTVVCRCEEVTAGAVRQYAALGCIGPNQAKAFGRAGMGPCQGRYCGLTVTELLAQANENTQEETGYYRIRPPLKPVTLAELASLSNDETREAEE